MHFTAPLLAAAIAAANPAPATDECKVDRATLLRLDFDAFDRHPGGWRALEARAECRDEAAALLADYRTLTEARRRNLAWHEGQVRAELGETEAAIALMETARKPPVMFSQRQDDWNAYVDATIAFLRGDKPALLAARERLASFPWPDNYSYLDENGVKQTRRPANWPMNLNVVDGLVRCFGRPYAEAYRQACREARQ